MIPFWKPVPFIRILIPFSLGIVTAWYLQLSWVIAVGLLSVAAVLFILFPLLHRTLRFRFRWLQGTSINLFLFATGVCITWLQPVTHHQQWYGHHATPNSIVRLRLLEPLSEKEKSYKALAEFMSCTDSNRHTIPVTGRLMLYFKKDSTPPSLQYGSIIATTMPVPEIKNAGNPGGFDYKRYALFNGITHQLFLKSGQYVQLKETDTNLFWYYLYQTRDWILHTLRTYITGDAEQSVAEALLIGFRDDLDRNLVQAYSNTGVVHVIAISGLHLGLIYSLLLFLLKPLDKRKETKWIKAVLILSFLWIFSLLTGAGASVIRAAIMFTFILLGEILGKKGNILNSMAASAVLMLFINPFLLWDVGFQLSYAAVLSIVLFMKPIHHLLTFQNKLVDQCWQLTAVTLSAQILTLPLCMYHFHQAPNLFLITNFVAVPLSSIILFGEIVLLVLAFVPVVAVYTGIVVSALLRWMNQFILWADHFSFAVTDGIMLTPLETIFLYCMIGFAAAWLLHKRPAFLKWSLLFVLSFFASKSYHAYQTHQQQRMVVYNLSKYTAIDFMLGNQYRFVGDTVLLQDGFLRNFHLKPSRISYYTYSHPLPYSKEIPAAFLLRNKRILFLHHSFRFEEKETRIVADVVVVSGNPRLYINELVKSIDPKLIVFDSSNPQWKVKRWREDCERLHIKTFSTNDSGAFVMP